MPPPPHVPHSPAPSTTGSPAADRRYAWQVATNLWVSFRYAGQGIAYALRTQRNFRIHAAMGVIVLALGLGLALPAVQIAVLGLTCGGVLTLELINTALEAVVDLTVQQNYHELAKIAKDCAAAAVLISALVAVWVAVCLLVPALYQLIYSA